MNQNLLDIISIVDGLDGMDLDPSTRSQVNQIRKLAYASEPFANTQPISKISIIDLGKNSIVDEIDGWLNGIKDDADPRAIEKVRELVRVLDARKPNNKPSLPNDLARFIHTLIWGQQSDRHMLQALIGVGQIFAGYDSSIHGEALCAALHGWFYMESDPDPSEYMYKLDNAIKAFLDIWSEG